MAALKQIPAVLEGRRPTFAGGVHPAERKDIAEHLAIERPPLPPEVWLPLSMHAGAQARAVVAKQDEVRRGQLVAEAGGFVSAPIHSPVCGTVREIAARPHQSGRMVPAIVIATNIEATGEMLAAEAERGVPADLDLTPYGPAQIVERVKAGGLVGQGGAAFPTFIKLVPPKEKPTEIVILNGTECEPYLTADHRLMLEQPGPIVAGLRLAMKATGAPRGVIGIEDNKPDAIETLRRAVREAKVPERIEVCALKTKYPQGGERTLIPVLTGRSVPVGGFPPDIGVAIFNVGSALSIAHAVVYKQPLIERVLTLTGSGVARPGNLLVPIGTPLPYLIELRGGCAADAALVILGGPMMGPTAAGLDLPVLKGMSGVTVLTRSEAPPRREYACIRCGRCVDACPLGLTPALLARLGERRRPEEAARHHINACVECGCCAYVCPSHIPLVQYLRSAKAQARKLPR